MFEHLQHVRTWVGLPDAVAMVHLHLAGPESTLSDAQREELARLLCASLTLYSLDDPSHSARVVDQEELRAGRFGQGASVLVFADGRPPITSLVVTRTSLLAAVEKLKRTVK